MPIFLTFNLYGPNKASEKERKYCPTPCWSGESRTSYLGFLPSTICNCKLLRGVDILRDPFIREWSPVGRQKSAQSKGISTWSILNYFLPTPGCNLICLSGTPPCLLTTQNNQLSWWLSHPVQNILVKLNHVLQTRGEKNNKPLKPPNKSAKLRPPKTTGWTNSVWFKICFIPRSTKKRELGPRYQGPIPKLCKEIILPSLKLTVRTWEYTPGKGDSYWKPLFFREFSKLDPWGMFDHYLKKTQAKVIQLGWALKSPSRGFLPVIACWWFRNIAIKLGQM